MSTQKDLGFDDLTRSVLEDEAAEFADNLLLSSCTAIGKNTSNIEKNKPKAGDYQSLTAAHMIARSQYVLREAIVDLAESVDCMAARRSLDALPTPDESAVILAALKEQWLKAHPVHDVEACADAVRRFEKLAGL